MVAGIKPEHHAKVAKLVKVAAKAMSIVEDDGVGYAAIRSNGQIYGEKWLNKDDAFVIHNAPKIDPSIEFVNEMFGDMGDWLKTPVTTPIYDSFGQRTKEALDSTVGLILHARKASSGSKVVQNVHPFVMIDQENQPDTALIHNGAITNHEKLTKISSTCDSEVILHEYLANTMYHNPWGIEQLAKTLIGEYVVGVLSSTFDDAQNIIPVLDIFKANNKDLFAGYVPELDTMVFCTNEYTLTSSCKDADLTVKNLIKIKEGYLLRINALTGEKMELISFKPSSKFESGYTTHHAIRSSIGPQIKAVTPDVILPATESDKKHFERRHPGLFTLPYLEVNGSLQENERALFTELGIGKDTNHKALHLVAVALSSAVGRV